MICPKCSEEMPDGAAFCSKCGARVDGKVQCPACGSVNEQDAKFCAKCGTRLDGKTTCSVCGEEFAGNFCPKCGAQAGASATQPAARGTKSAKTVEWRKPLGLAGGICAMAGVFFAFLFTFFVGTSAYIDYPGMPSGNGFMFWSYFGEVYEFLADFEGDTVELFAQVLPSVLTTIVCVVFLIITVIAAIFSVVRYVRFMTGKSKKDYAASVLASMITFLTFAVTFQSVHAFSLNVTEYRESISSGIEYNGATVAGIVLVCICLAAFLGSRIAANVPSIFKSGRLVPFCLFGGSAILLFVLFFLSGGDAVCISAGNSSSSMSSGYGLVTLLQSARLSNGGESMALCAVACVGLAEQFVAIALIAATMGKAMTRLTESEQKPLLGHTILVAIFVILHMAFSIVSGWLFYTIQFGSSTTYSTSYGTVIAQLVFAILALAAMSVCVGFLNARKKSANTPVAAVEPIAVEPQTATPAEPEKVAAPSETNE